VSECVSVYVSECVSVYVSVYMSVYVSVCVSVHVPVCMSVYVSVCDGDGASLQVGFYGTVVDVSRWTRGTAAMVFPS
jgi:hypothetical protein